jgi:hypothetical protein
VEQDLPGNADSALEPVGQARETQRGTWPQLRPPMRQGLSAAQAG